MGSGRDSAVPEAHRLDAVMHRLADDAVHERKVRIRAVLNCRVCQAIADGQPLEVDALLGGHSIVVGEDAVADSRHIVPRIGFPCVAAPAQPRETRVCVTWDCLCTI